MAEIEDVVILNVQTGEAVRTVQDLRDNIKEYKQIISEAEIGTQEYQDAVKGLAENQNALKGAMYATTASLEDVTKAALGAGTSYNALVNRMADLKKEFRATTDEVRRADLGKQINEINDQLKKMDAMQGNFQRNVGNYTQGVSDALKDLAKDMPSFFGAAKNGVKDVSDSLALLGKQPIMGLVLLLAPILTKIVEKLKENGTALEAIKKVGDALEPVFDVLTKTVEWLAQQLSKAADWFVELLGNSNGTFKAIISGAVGAGNAILQALLTPIKTAIEAVKGFGSAIGKVFKGDFSGALDDAKTAGQNIGKAIKDGFSFEANFDKGKEVAENFINGLDSSHAKAAKAGKDTGKAYKDAFEEEVLEDDAENALKQAEANDKARRAEADKALANAQELARIKEEGRQKEAAAEAALTATLAKEQEKRKEDAKKNAEYMAKAWGSAVSATASILSSLADIYEATNKDDLKAQKKAKNLRIASAAIQTIQGAIGAYMQSVASIPPPAGIIAGVAQAATVTAAGLANIAKMRSTSLDSSSTATASPSFSGGTSVSASPTAQPIASPTSLATLATDTQLLNQMGSQRVYILASDIEASNNARKVQVAETTF